jgi:hypothetical protein
MIPTGWDSTPSADDEVGPTETSADPKSRAMRHSVHLTLHNTNHPGVVVAGPDLTVLAVAKRLVNAQ